MIEKITLSAFPIYIGRMGIEGKIVRKTRFA